MKLQYLFLFAAIISAPYSRGESNVSSKDTIERGSWISAFIHRAELRKCSQAIAEGTVTPDQIRTYIAQGGSVDVFRSYDAVHDFFAGGPGAPLLNNFISDKKSNDSIERQESRVESLRLLLQAGANPNFITTGLGSLGSFPPVLFAAAANDLAALHLLVAHGGNIHLMYKEFLFQGPAVNLASDPVVLDFLIANGADVKGFDEYGQGLIARTLNVPIDMAARVAKVKYLLSKGAPIKGGKNREKTAVDDVRINIEIIERNIVDAEKSKQDQITFIRSESKRDNESESEAQARREAAVISVTEEHQKYAAEYRLRLAQFHIIENLLVEALKNGLP